MSSCVRVPASWSAISAPRWQHTHHVPSPYFLSRSKGWPWHAASNHRRLLGAERAWFAHLKPSYGGHHRRLQMKALLQTPKCRSLIVPSPPQITPPKGVITESSCSAVRPWPFSGNKELWWALNEPSFVTRSRTCSSSSKAAVPWPSIISGWTSGGT